MKLVKNERVAFNEKDHTYLLDGVKMLSGVTSLLKRQGLAPDYGMVDRVVLEYAAARGTDLHRAIQAYLEGRLYFPEDEGTYMLLAQFKELQNKFAACEYLVSDNETVASMVDLVEDRGDGTAVLWDVKRTAVLHRDSVRWQLSIYAYLFERQTGIRVSGIKALHLHDEMREVDLARVPDEEVEKLLRCDAEHMRYVYEAPLDIQAVADIVARKFQELEEREADLKAQKAKLEEEKETLRAYMEKEGMKTWETGGVKITRILATTRTSVDSAKLKASWPEVYDACLKTSAVKESLKITRAKS